MSDNTLARPTVTKTKFADFKAKLNESHLDDNTVAFVIQSFCQVFSYEEQSVKALHKKYAEARQKRFEDDPDFHKQCIQKMIDHSRQKYQEDPAFREKRKEYARIYYQKKKQAAIINS
jgi:hypothetical protein